MDNNSEIENVMPHDAQAEQAVLGSIFLDENALAEAIKNCGDDITRANVRDNLAQIKDFPILGGTTVTFEPEGYVHLQYVTVTVRDGEWVPYQ